MQCISMYTVGPYAMYINDRLNNLHNYTKDIVHCARLLNV